MVMLDAADPNREAQITAVETILRELELAETPRLLVYNKIDRTTQVDRDVLAGIEGAVSISALDGKTCLPLLQALEHALWREGVGDAPQGHPG